MKVNKVDFSSIKTNVHYYNENNIKVERYNKYKNDAFTFVGHSLCHIDELSEDIKTIRKHGEYYHIYFQPFKNAWGAVEQEKIVVDIEFYEELRRLGVLD
ncbi:hypothetical protein [Listeria booriae]|uniref:Uncharacterized protein n=1 Tax=Listeria booriae TaxID=1552123 RepID=A0A7X0WDH3_9LIST|nr:hypothetical protein [Listeria booriae]MBC1331063.1 hypothetical protein [Listeria booriae]